MIHNSAINEEYKKTLQNEEYWNIQRKRMCGKKLKTEMKIILSQNKIKTTGYPRKK